MKTNALTNTILITFLLFIIIVMPGCMESGKLESITVTPGNATIIPGANQQFSATAHFSNGTNLDWTTAAVWTVLEPQDSTIGNSVGTYGLLVSAAAGTYLVQAMDTANNISGRAVLSVDIPKSIHIIPAAPFMAKETTHQFAVSAVFLNGTTYDMASLATWTTTEQGVATVVSSTGVVTSGSTGTTDLISTYTQTSYNVPPGKSKLTVTDLSVESIEIVSLTDVLLIGTQTQFTAGGNYPGNPTPLDFTSSVIWSSSNPDVASIDSMSGLVTGKSTGTIKIKALDPVSALSGEKELTIQ